MTKKIFIALTILFATFFLSSSVFAVDTIEDGLKDMGTEAKDSWDKLGGAVQNVGNNTKSAMDNMGDKAKSAMNNDDNNNDDDGYQATRTSAMTNNGNLFGMNSTTWTWFILGIVGVVIVALIWYYASEQTNTGRNNNNR